MNDRKQAIQTLEIIMKRYLTLDKDELCALQFAIDSMKVDRAYDLAYEKVDFIEIPDGATFGDMMKNVFPQFEVFVMGDNQQVTVLCGEMRMDFSKDLWNSPYRKEN